MATYVIPNSSVLFLNVPLDPDYENTMYFDNIQQQTDWFTARAMHGFEHMTYQRKSRGVMRIGFPEDMPGSVKTINQLYNANYMMYKNTNYENKWFYAFVTNAEYVNNNTVEISYQIDVMQTWFFDYTFHQCFIERMHTPTDNIGQHTLPEKIELGPYVENIPTFSVDGSGPVSSGYFEYSPAICLITTFGAGGAYQPGQIIHGQSAQGDMFSGLYYSVYPLTQTGVDALNSDLADIVDGAMTDGVVALFMLPLDFATSITGGSVAPVKNLGFDIRSTNPSTGTYGYYIGSYRPRNKKLMCYPYNMLYVTNNQGNEAEYKWEDFNNPIACALQIWGNVSPNGGMTCIPAGYKGVTGRNVDEAIQVTGFPLCSWTNDAFKAWLAQNVGTLISGGLNHAMGWETAVTQIASGLGTTGVLGAFSKTINTIGQIFDHKRRPPQSHGNGNVTLSFQSGMLTFNFYRKHIKEEYAKIIDAFFDMYGYQINTVGTPVRKTRDYYTYIKTVGCNIEGQIPATDAKEINAIYDKGIRFWTTAATFGSFDPNVNPNEITIVG